MSRKNGDLQVVGADSGGGALEGLIHAIPLAAPGPCLQAEYMGELLGWQVGAAWLKSDENPL